MTNHPHISTYPVGILSDFKAGRLRGGIENYLLYQIKARNWRAVRNYFNGYLAEWHYAPEGVNLTMCGKGWTRKAALHSLGRHIIEANAPEIRGTH